MPAIIQNTPVFTPFSFEQYIAPLNAYKQEYDAIEKQYNEVEAAASALEALAADDPHSQAYRTYRNYADKLRAEADALAYNGLTPGSRERLRNIRSKYTTDIIPIVRGMEKWEKEKARYDNLKDGEIMSNNPYTSGVDYYIGANPSSRVLNLERVRKNAELTGKAWSERLYGDLSPLALNGVYDGAAFMMSQLQGFVAGGPEGQNSTIELRNAAQSLSSGKSNPYSEGITLLANQLESLGYDQFDTQGKKEILNSVLLGYGQGLNGAYEYRNLPTSLSNNGSNAKPIITNIPSVHSRTIPLIEGSPKAKDDILRLGADYNASSKSYTFDPQSKTAISKLDLWLGTVSTGRNASSPIYVPIQTAVENYQGIMSGEYKYHSHNQDRTIDKSQKNKLEKIVNTIETYNPEIAKQIKEGTYSGNIHEDIANIIQQVTDNTLDYGARIYDITLTNADDTKVLTEAVNRYIKESNDGQVQTMTLSADGKTFAETDAKNVTKINTDFYKNLSVTGISFLPTDSSNIIVNATLEGESIAMKIPITAINDQAAQALQFVTQLSKAYEDFETQYGKYQEPSATATTTTDMEDIWTEVQKAKVELANKPRQEQNNIAEQQIILEHLKDLARVNGKETNYYIDLYAQWQSLNYGSQAMYPRFVQDLARAIGTVDIKAVEQNSGIPTVTGFKE